MKFLSSLSLLAIPLLAAAAPAAEPVSQPEGVLEQRQCLVNSANIKTWHENGLTRRRTHHSANPDSINLYGRQEFVKIGKMNGGSRFEWWNDAGGWFVDSSWMLGGGGDSGYFVTLTESRRNWKEAYGCTTG